MVHASPLFPPCPVDPFLFFGELRSLLHRHTHTHETHAHIVELIEEAHAFDPVRYEQEWKGYVSGFARKLQEVVRSCEDVAQLKWAQEVMPWAPLHLRLQEGESDIPALLAFLNTHHANIVHIGLYAKISEQHIKALLDAPGLRHLHTLEVSGFLSHSVLTCLLTSKGWPGMRAFCWHCLHPSTQQLESLLACPWLRKLEQLTIICFEEEAERLRGRLRRAPQLDGVIWRVEEDPLPF